MRVLCIGLFCSLVAVSSFAQISGTTARINDFSSYTPANPIFFNDSTRFARPSEYDSLGVPTTYPVWGRGRLVGRGSLGFYLQTHSSIVKMVMETDLPVYSGVNGYCLVDSSGVIVPYRVTSGKLLGRYGSGNWQLQEITISTGLNLDVSGNLTSTATGGADGQDADSIRGKPADSTGRATAGPSGVTTIGYSWASQTYKPYYTPAMDTANAAAADTTTYYLMIRQGKIYIINRSLATAAQLGAKADSTDRETRTHTGATFAPIAQTMYIGTTSHAINRGNASEALTGITSIDGSAATLTTARDIGGRSFNGSANITAPTWKCGQGTRDISTASGAQNIAHGLGRVPSYVHLRFQLIFSASQSQENNAYYDGTSQSGMTIAWAEGSSSAVTDVIYQSTASAVGLSNAAGTNPFSGATKASGVITVDATNIIITWTKSGSPTGTANYAWEVQ